MQTYSLTSTLLDSVVYYSLEAPESKGTSAGKRKQEGESGKKGDIRCSFLFFLLFSIADARISLRQRDLFIQTE